MPTPTIDLGTNLTLPQRKQGPFTSAAPLTQDFAVVNNPLIRQIQFAGNFASADLQNPALMMGWEIILVNQDNSDGAQVAGCPWPGTCWQGGQTDPRTGTFFTNPVFTATGEGVTSMLGKTCRLKVTLSAQFSGFGGTVTVN